MSFILDALKKSETERQQVAPAEFATVASTPDEPRAPRWLWILGALLAVNLVVVLGLLLRPTPTAPSSVAEPLPQAAEPTTLAVATEAAESFSSRVAEARRNQPATPPPAPTTSIETRPPASTVAAGSATTAAPTVAREQAPTPRPAVAPAPDNALLLPTFNELRVNGVLQMAELHIDIHVYDQSSTKRFVFINMNKYREGAQLSEGPVVREITPEGVVLEHQGRRFLLARE